MIEYFCSRCGSSVSPTADICPSCKTLLSGISEGSEERRRELQEYYREEKRERRREAWRHRKVWITDNWLRLFITIGVIIGVYYLGVLVQYSLSRPIAMGGLLLIGSIIIVPTQILFGEEWIGVTRALEHFILYLIVMTVYIGGLALAYYYYKAVEWTLALVF